IPLQDPYEEAARQALEQAPLPSEYVPDPMELEDHVPVYIPEPEHPEDLVPAEDEAPKEPYITEVASAPTPPLPPPSFLPTLIRPPHTRAAMAQRRATAPSIYHSLLLVGTPPLLPIPLPAPSTSRRADTPPQKRILHTAPTTRVEVGESSAAAARQPGSTMAPKVDHSFVDTVDTREAQEDRAAVRAEIEILRRERGLLTSKRASRPVRPWLDDFTVRHIMRTQALEAGARVDSLVDTCSSSIDYGYDCSYCQKQAGLGMALRELSDSLDGLRKLSMCLALAIAQQLVKSNSRLALCKTMLLHGGILMLRPLPSKKLCRPWATLKKMMTDKYCLRGEIKKIETEMWNLKVKGSRCGAIVDDFSNSFDVFQECSQKRRHDCKVYSVDCTIDTWQCKGIKPKKPCKRLSDVYN
ncbi:hypothetical protein Tco_1163423, partial [Tanacetum coccineum]